jgi:hypothetical protein
MSHDAPDCGLETAVDRFLVKWRMNAIDLYTVEES